MTQPFPDPINARLDYEAEADAKFIQDTELMRRDLNATFNDTDRGVPIKEFSPPDPVVYRRDESPPSSGKSCRSCGAAIHPGILRKAPNAALCYECFGREKKRR